MPGKRNAQEDFTVLSQFLQWAELQGEEAEAFVKEIMTRRGHKPVTGWRESDESEGGQKQEPSNVFGLIPGGQKKASGSNWQYGG